MMIKCRQFILSATTEEQETERFSKIYCKLYYFFNISYFSTFVGVNCDCKIIELYTSQNTRVQESSKLVSFRIVCLDCFPFTAYMCM